MHIVAFLFILWIHNTGLRPEFHVEV